MSEHHEVPDVAGPPVDGDEVVVSYRDQTLRFAPFGGKIEARLRTNTFYEGELLHYIEALGLRGTYLDIGGYVGTHALFFARYCAADAVHSWEPRAHCYDHLAGNIARNGLGDRLTGHKAGLSDREESISLTLGGKTEQIACHPLDQVVETPVCVMKLDVEGMEAKVLAGATRILRAHKPLVFVEAHTKDELDADLLALAPFGYRLTGRVFNASPTYELAAADSPTAGTDRLPVTHSLLDAAWTTDDPAVSVKRTPAGLVVTSTLAGDVKAHATQPNPNAKRAPEVDLVELPAGATVFVQAMGHAADGLEVAIVLSEYDDHGRLDAQRIHFHPRLFQKVTLSPATRRVRVSIRVGGAGAVTLDTLALHVLAPRVDAADVAAIVRDHAVPGAVIFDRTSPGAKLGDALAGLGAPVTREVPAGTSPVVVTVQDLPSARAGHAARGPVPFDATLAPWNVHVVLCDAAATVLERGVLARAAQDGWALVTARPTTSDRLPFALAFARLRSTVPADVAARLAIANERRFAALLAVPAEPEVDRSLRARLGRAVESLRG